jgi:hypothetical protein
MLYRLDYSRVLFLITCHLVDPTSISRSMRYPSGSYIFQLYVNLWFGILREVCFDIKFVPDLGQISPEFLPELMVECSCTRYGSHIRGHFLFVSVSYLRVSVRYLRCRFIAVDDCACRFAETIPSEIGRRMTMT